MIMPMLLVKDVDATIAFYEKLGFKRDIVLPNAQGVNAFAFVRLNAHTVFGLGLDEENKPKPFGNGVQFMVYLDPKEQSIELHYSQTAANGILITDPLGMEYWGDRTYSISDPDGYWITFAQTVNQADLERVSAVMRGEASAEKQL